MILINNHKTLNYLPTKLICLFHIYIENKKMMHIKHKKWKRLLITRVMTINYMIEMIKLVCFKERNIISSLRIDQDLIHHKELI